MNRRQLKKLIRENNKTSKYKCELTDEVVRTICNAETVEQEAMIRALYNLIENPKSGDKMDMKKIRARKYEICECGDKLEIYLDKNSDEVYFNCKNKKCKGFWMTKKEFEDGRREYAKQNRKTSKRT